MVLATRATAEGPAASRVAGSNAGQYSERRNDVVFGKLIVFSNHQLGDLEKGPRLVEPDNRLSTVAFLGPAQLRCHRGITSCAIFFRSVRRSGPVIVTPSRDHSLTRGSPDRMC
jgi:hypothetical protein